MAIYEEDNTVVIDSTVYAKHVIDTYPKFVEEKNTPTLAEEPIIGEKAGEAGKQNRKIIGKLMWLQRTVRPDIAFATVRLSKRLTRWDHV